MSPEPSPAYARILAANERHVDAYDRAELGPKPLAGLAVLTCMDARIDPLDALGLRPGDAHVIRNAGAVVTDDVVRSLILSQQVTGTTEMLVIAHTGCALAGLDEAELRGRLGASSGRDLDVEFLAFGDLAEHVRHQVRRLAGHAWLERVPVHGLVYDVATGRLDEVA